MDYNLIESKADMGLNLEGNNCIDALLLADTIKSFAELANKTSIVVNPDAYVKINVTAFESGSFDIIFSALSRVKETLLNNPQESIKTAQAIIASVVGIFTIKKFLKGDKPEKIQTGKKEACITNKDGELLAVPKASTVIFSDTEADQHVTNIVNNINVHNPNGGFNIVVNGKTESFTPTDVNSMMKPIPAEDTITRQVTLTRTDLTIKHPDIMGHSAWGFYLDKKYIRANITDGHWLERLHNREFLIGYKDRIDVNLEVSVDIDRTGNPDPNTIKYTVVRVFGDVINEADQLEL